MLWIIPFGVISQESGTLTEKSGPSDYTLAERNALNSISDTVNKPLLRKLVAGTGVLYAGSIYGLYTLWYKDYPQSSFHFFNDNKEWMQTDKIGHATSAYYISMLGYEALSIAGVKNNQSAIYGGALAMLYLTTVETFDGFSAGWGASWGDLTANTTGTLLFVSQQLTWQEQRIRLKWSYHPTKYAQYRPDLLGENGIQSALKDYNGHTYWLIGNVSSFLHSGSRFPKWLNIAAGYNATGMTGAFNNPDMHEGVKIPDFDRYRSYLLSADIDLTKIPVRSKSLRLVLSTLGFIKIPMPAVQFSKNGVKFHALYF
ncbi:MAG TPA: DUF2279 domain-containing protein [Bacteroidales bacterium]|nr:DUF2279 domain-containing protein [Bacteroidales bacterium]